VATRTSCDIIYIFISPFRQIISLMAALSLCYVSSETVAKQWRSHEVLGATALPQLQLGFYKCKICAVSKFIRVACIFSAFPCPPKCICGHGSAPDPDESLQCSPRPPSWWGRGSLTPPQESHHCYRRRFLARRASIRPLPSPISGYRPML